jgi:P27 family predicted phage terminase small subunit
MGARGPLAKERAAAGRVFRAGLPPAPGWLKTAARREYEALAALVPERGDPFTEADAGLAALWADAYAEVQEHSAKLAVEGYAMKGDRGAVLNPRVRALRDARAACERLAQVLGLSPAARARLPDPPPSSKRKGGGDEPTTGPEAFVAKWGEMA